MYRLFSAILPGSLKVVSPIILELLGSIDDWFHDTAKVIILHRMDHKGVSQ